MRCPGCGYTANHLNATSCKLCGTPMNEKRREIGGRPARRAPVPESRMRRGGGAEQPAKPRKEWKRYMLEQPGGFPKNLDPGKRFVFGRSKTADLTIPSQRVSREHAELIWEGEKALIKDLGSQNGTQVNGRPAVQPIELKDGDEITVGPFTCVYRCTSGAGSVAKVDRSAASAKTIADMADTLAGNLEQLSLWELLDTLEHNEKTGTLEVFHPEGQAAKLVISNGWPIQANLDEQSGREAVYGMLAWDEGMYRFSGGPVPDAEPNLERVTINALLHEAHERLGG